jgi:tRNA G18 (ribose-2'-O)-methylase SpoU
MCVSREMSPRRQLWGVREIADALQGGELPRLLLVRRGTEDREVLAIADEARTRGIAVRYASGNDLKRMCVVRSTADVLALLGPDPGADAHSVLALDGAAWLLTGVAYPGNAGFAIRTAEVSGADGIFIDSDRLDRFRHKAVRASMRANRFFPVHWLAANTVVEMAREAGKRVVGIEDTGTKAPWECDLTGSVLLTIGGEGSGVRDEVLAVCDEVIRIPMRGFVPSYNLQAAMAAIAIERLRQIERGAKPGVL